MRTLRIHHLIVACALMAWLMVTVVSEVAAHDTADFEDVSIAFIPAASDLEVLSDGRILVLNKSGSVRIVQDGSLLPGSALDISAIVCDDVERGLVGITTHPDFEANGWVYLYYTYAKHGNCGQSDITGPANRASRFTMTGNSIDPASELILFESRELYKSNHNSGYMAFGKDGFLYVSVGDGFTPRFWGRPQDPGFIQGKIVRVTDDGDIPPGNPYTGPDSADCSADGVIPAGSTATKCQQVYAKGLRNPYRLAFDPNAPDTRFYINEVGQTVWEEINEGQAGADYGWPTREGPCAYGSTTDCSVPVGVVDPVHWYLHDGGAAITGGAFVPNGIWPSEYDDTYIYGDYVTNELFVMESGGADCRTCEPPTSPFIGDLFADTANNVTNLQFGPHGDTQALYALYGGFLRRISYVGDANRTPVARATASSVAGDVPLVVSFTGSTSSDPDGDPLTYLWDFGDGSTSTEADPSHTYTGAASLTATLTVDDGQGGVDSDTVRIDPGNNAPIVSIDSPGEAEEYFVGEQLTLTGSALDVEDGQIPDAQLTWEVLLHHNTHVHPFLAETSGNNLTVTGPAPEDIFAALDSYLEIILTATDAQGVSTTTTLDVQPSKVDLTFETVPSGLDVVVDGFVFTSPATVTSWEGNDVLVRANTQNLNGTDYYWSNWSQGGTATQLLSVPPVAQSYTATFATTPPPLKILPGVVRALEGDAGLASMEVPVSLSVASAQTVTAAWTTLLGFTSANEDDMVQASGTVTFEPGEVNKTITLDVYGDTVFEADDTVVVSFTNPTGGATIGGFWGLGFAVVQNDDAAPVLEPAFVSVVEGDTASTLLDFTVDLVGQTELPVTVEWSANDFEATAGSDFTAASGSLTFEPGVASKTIQLEVLGDETFEGDEAFSVQLQNPQNASLGGYFGFGSVTILDDEAVPKIVPGGVQQDEGTGTTTTFSVPIALTVPSQSVVTVSWSTLDYEATAPGDYVAASGSVTFEPGQTLATIDLVVVADAEPEPTELALISLSNAVGANIGGYWGLGFVFIQNDDGLPPQVDG